MAEYIDRDALDYQFEKHQEISKYGSNRQRSKGFREARKMLEGDPAAEVALVVHGWWEKVPTHPEEVRELYACSMCDVEWDCKTRFCPNCGAKMDGNTHDHH